MKISKAILATGIVATLLLAGCANKTAETTVQTDTPVVATPTVNLSEMTPAEKASYYQQKAKEAMLKLEQKSL